nr:MAG TPA: hypothetical protein [Caudoviricetes sp.]
MKMRETSGVPDKEPVDNNNQSESTEVSAETI